MYKKIPLNLVKINPNKTIKDAMRLLNIIDESFLLVATKDKKLLGTITDGDIRRAMLKGINIDKKVEYCMNKRPITSNKVDEEISFLFKKMTSTDKFLPIINREKKILSILLENTKKIERTALIMAGGYGRRLGKITKNIPKPLLKIKSKPILETILQNLEEADYKKIYIATHYLHERIEKFLSNRKSISNIEIIFEPSPLGTAGSIHEIKNENFKNLTVLNGDIISEINLDAMNQFHAEKKYDLTLSVSYYSYTVPFGVIEFDKNYNYKSLSEKPVKKHFILSGIYCLSKKACNLATKKYLDMPQLIDHANKLGYKIGIFPIYEYWNDIGTSKSLSFEKSRKKKNK